ncbi:MAG: Tol-Pal system protein TolR [Chlamydiae bacterium]|nr:Tol-Pal system protein TolR [Chlamydiota bacterium]
MSRRNFFQSSGSVEEPGINLMPLIDVVFVVLVMFIIIAPMVNIDRIELAQGVSTVQQNKIDQTLVVHIRADNTYWLNQRQVTLNELNSLLNKAKKSYPNATPQIMPDKNASFQAYENVRTASKKAGFDFVDVNLSP